MPTKKNTITGKSIIKIEMPQETNIPSDIEAKWRESISEISNKTITSMTVASNATLEQVEKTKASCRKTMGTKLTKLYEKEKKASLKHVAKVAKTNVNNIPSKASIKKARQVEQKKLEKLLNTNGTLIDTIKKEIKKGLKNAHLIHDKELFANTIVSSLLESIGAAQNYKEKLTAPFTTMACYVSAKDNHTSGAVEQGEMNNSLNPINGSISSVNSIYARNNVGDFDNGFIQYSMGYSHAYKMPLAGILKVTIVVRNLDGVHSASTDDEPGYSTAFIGQSVFLNMRIYKDKNNIEEKNVPMSIWKKTSKDGSWNDSPFDRETEYNLQMESNASFEKGEYVFIDFGQLIKNIVTVNDVKFNSSMSFSWIFESVKIEVI